jgi:hypothetical protein
VEKVEGLLLFGIHVRVKHVTPGLKAAQTGAVKVSAFGGRLLSKIRHGSQQALKRRVEFVGCSLAQDRHVEGFNAAGDSRQPS